MSLWLSCLLPLSNVELRYVNNILFVQGIWEENLQLSKRAASVAREARNASMVSRWLSDCGWVLTWIDKFTEAQESLTEAQRVAGEIGDVENFRNAVHNMGVLQYRIGNYQQAKELLHSSLGLALEREDDREIVGDWYYLGCTAFKQGDFNEALSWFNQVKVRGQEIKWARAYAYACNWLADIEIIQGDNTQTRRLLEESFIVAQNFHDQRRLAYSNRSFALLEEVEGDKMAAQDFAREAHDLFIRLGMRQEVEEMARVLQRLAGD